MAHAIAWGRGMTYEKPGQNKISRELNEMLNRRLGIRDEIPKSTGLTPQQAYNEAVRVPGFMVANNG